MLTPIVLNSLNAERQKEFKDECREKSNEMELCIQSAFSKIDAESKKAEERLNLVQGQCDSMQTAFASLEHRQLVLETTTMDGHLLWKVDNLEQKIQDAKNNRIKSLHSQPCLTTKIGYKFCARLYLNGDGASEGKHVSLYFVLMRSNHDCLLTWPFPGRIVFRLLNPKNRSQSVEYSFKALENFASFQRPTEEMNIAYGAQSFIDIEGLHNGGFVVEDAIFIEIVVDENSHRGYMR